MIAEYDDCECTIDNFWKNMKTIDPLHDLKLTCGIMNKYFSNYEENKNKTLKDLELELREHDLNVGLIAVNADEHVEKAISSGKVCLVKPQYMDIYSSKKGNSIKNIDPSHVAKYMLNYSCRPRQYVIQETLEHSKSIEEKLLDCGVCMY